MWVPCHPMHTRENHKEKEKQQSIFSCLFFQPSNSKFKQKESASSTSSSIATIDTLIIQLPVSKSEIRWVLRVVLPSFSLRLRLNWNALFKEILLNSRISEKFKLSKTKYGCYLTYGIAPYLKSSITKSILKAPYFKIMFVQFYKLNRWIYKLDIRQMKIVKHRQNIMIQSF